MRGFNMFKRSSIILNLGRIIRDLVLSFKFLHLGLKEFPSIGFLLNKLLVPYLLDWITLER